MPTQPFASRNVFVSIAVLATHAWPCAVAFAPASAALAFAEAPALFMLANIDAMPGTQ